MEKTKLLTVAVIGLLLINIGTLGFLFLNGPKGHHRPPREGRPEPKEVIIEQLHFDAQQKLAYEKLIQWHRGEITEWDEKIRKTKRELYSELRETSVDIKTKDSLVYAISMYQQAIEQTHFKHFEDIKKLCHQDQLEDFNALTEELSRIFAPKPRGPRHD